MSRPPLRLAMLVLSVAGIAIAGYLTSVYYADIEPVCAGGGGGCERVQASSWSELAGVPVALLGLGGYVAILASLLVRGEAARLATASLALVGAAYSGYLTYVELFEIDAICQWCVASAVILTVLAALACIDLMRLDAAPRRPDPRHRAAD